MKVLAPFCPGSGVVLPCVTALQAVHDTRRRRRPGFRTRSVPLATPRLRRERHRAGEIGEACLRRWRIELSGQDITTTTEMGQARDQGPAIAVQALLAGLIAGNRVRLTMIEATRRPGPQEPRAARRRAQPFTRLTKPRHAYRETAPRSRGKSRESGDAGSSGAG